MLEGKTEEFRVAMDIYHSNICYNKFYIVVASVIIGSQFVLVSNLVTHCDDINSIIAMLVLIFAYIATDFINGCVHMYMDNCTSYKSIVGPFVAAFHMHHKHQRYKMRNPIVVYFIESGSKFWLVVYLLLLIYAQHKIDLYLNVFLIAIGVFSSFAEVSHYWCHNSDKNNFIINAMQKFRILLPKNHHQVHHIKDNMNYAFLNGTTDPILNIIAKYLYNGYKKHSDLHVLAYNGKQTNNRD